MELHESLHELGSRLGHGLFSDADNFRGALDDYVDETSATTGDINLLVDAVRLGAFRSMTSMLDTGASADSAITEAGARLARDRGSSEAAGAMWACAVLGYAIDQVSETQLRRYAAQRSGSQPPPPGMAGHPQPPAPQGPPMSSPPYQSPPQPYQSPAPHQSPPHQSPPQPYPPQPAPQQQPPPPAWPSSGGAAGQTSADRTAMAGAAGASSLDRATNPKQPMPPPQPPGAYPAAGPPGGGQRERKLWPIIAAAAAVLLVLGIGIPTAIVLTNGGDEEPATETVARSTVDETYVELGESVTAGSEECVVADRAQGQTEAIECTGEDGTLRLVTYGSEDDLESARDDAVSTSQGSILIEQQQGTFYGFDPTAAESDDSARLYWDNGNAAQAATYEPAEETDDPLATMLESFEATSPTLDGPDEVDSSDLSGFLETFNVSGCDRIPNLRDGVTESDECQLEGYDVYVGQFEQKSDFNRNRRPYREAAKSAGCPNRFNDNSKDCVNDLWFTNLDGEDGYQPQNGDVERGKIWANTDDGDGVVYTEQLDCRCYLVMVGEGETADAVTKVLANQLGG